MTSGIIEILIENSIVATLVGVDEQSVVKVYPFIAPQKVKQPYILVSEISVSPTLSKGCISDLDFATYQVNCYGLSFYDMEVLQEACRNALDTGAGFTTDAGAEFGSVYMTNRQDLFFQIDGSEKGGLYVKSGTYQADIKRVIT